MTHQVKAARPARPAFRRNQDYVVVRPVRLTPTTVITPGTVIKPGDFRRHHMRSLHRRRRIGPVGSPWTEYMLSGFVTPEKAAELAAEREALAALEEKALIDDEARLRTAKVAELADALGVKGEDLEAQLEGADDWRAVVAEILAREEIVLEE